MRTQYACRASSTIATERLTNYALQIPSRREFIHELTSKVPVRPEYFSQDAEINRAGAAALSQLPELTPIQPQELKVLLDAGVTALDVRPGDAFASGHVPGSINIALSGQFASWAGSVLGLSSRPVLIAETAEQISEARLRLARVGIEDARGFLQGGFAAWKEAGLPFAEFQQISVETLRSLLESGQSQVLDVRREGEWKDAHIQGAMWPPSTRSPSLYLASILTLALQFTAKVATEAPLRAVFYSAPDSAMFRTSSAASTPGEPPICPSRPSNPSRFEARRNAHGPRWIHPGSPAYKERRKFSTSCIWDGVKPLNCTTPLETHSRSSARKLHVPRSS